MGVESFTPVTTATRLSLPLNGTIYTTVRSVASEKPTPVVGASMESELGAAWKDSLIIAANIVPVNGIERQQIVHARIPRQTAQLASNWEFSTCSINGRVYPSVQRTVILVANAALVPSGVTMDVVAHDTPAIGSAMPFVAADIFDGKGYILADREVAQSGIQLEPVFRLERRNYIIRSTRKSIGSDSLNGKPLWAETTLYFTGEVVAGVTPPGTTVDQLFADEDNAYWGLQNNGILRTGERLSCAWFTITKELVITGTFSGGAVVIDSYQANQRFYWPPVLDTFEFLDWVRRDGGTDIYPRYEFEPDEYDGACKSTVTRTWKRTPFTGLTVDQFEPTPVHYASPYFSLSIPSCLHPAVNCRCDTGNNDPVYKQNVGSLRTVAATAQTSWPATMRAYDDQQPFRGGFLRTTVIVYKPGT